MPITIRWVTFKGILNVELYDKHNIKTINEFRVELVDMISSSTNIYYY